MKHLSRIADAIRGRTRNGFVYKEPEILIYPREIFVLLSKQGRCVTWWSTVGEVRSM